MKVFNGLIKWINLFSEPLKSIREHSLHFSAWLVIVIVFGLAGFWVQLLVLIIRKPVNLTLQNIINVATLAPFVIVILADGIASMLGSVKAGSNITAAGIRVLVGSIALVVVFIQVVILSIIQSNNFNQKPTVNTPVGFQIILTIMAILIASYLYFFRFLSWEKEVADLVNSENKEVNNLSKSAGIQSKDSKGVKL